MANLLAMVLLSPGSLLKVKLVERSEYMLASLSSLVPVPMRRWEVRCQPAAATVTLPSLLRDTNNPWRSPCTGQIPHPRCSLWLKDTPRLSHLESRR